MVLYNILLKHRILDRIELCLTILYSGLIHSTMNISCMPPRGMLHQGDRHKISSHESSNSVRDRLNAYILGICFVKKEAIYLLKEASSMRRIKQVFPGEV